jgi:hypothetical protein
MLPPAGWLPGDTNGTWDVFYADNPFWDDTLFANGFESIVP